MLKLTLTAVAAIAITTAAAYADDAEISGNTGLGDVGAFTYVGSDTTNNSNNSSTYNTTTENATTVNNGAQKPNGYVTTVQNVAAPGTCGTSMGGGFSAAGIGLSAGKVNMDAECNRRANSALEHNQWLAKVQVLKSLGLQTTAVSLLCQDESIRISMKKAIPADQYKQLCKSYEN